MTIEEINELEKELEQAREKLEDYKQALLEQELKDKQHKSLSDYRIYEYLGYGEKYKYISFYNKIEKTSWYDTSGDNFDEIQVKKGNVYSIDTPDELLEREVKKRQLWFELEKHLKEKGCLATNEDWKDGSTYKYIVCFDFDKNTFEIDWNKTYKTNTIYSTHKEVLRNYMNTLTNEDIKIMFGVE